MISQLLIGMTLAIGQTGPNDSFSLAPSRSSASESSVFPDFVLKAIQPPADKTPAPDLPPPNVKENGKAKENGNGNGKKKEEEPKPAEPNSAVCRFFKAYVDAWKDGLHQDNRLYPPKKEGEQDEPEEPKPARRALDEPWSSPPFPGHEYQGYPLMGVPRDESVYPLMKAINGIETFGIGDWFKDNHIKIYGWATASGNFSTSPQTNAPTSYWIVANSFQLDQAVLRFEREADTVQTDHWDWGFRSTFMYGEDYRYTTAGGWMSDQLLKNNRLYGLDPIEQYVDVYVPKVWGDTDMVVRFGRWVACPDIETQLAPDNYMGSHSLLFTYDTYTQTGIMATFRLNDQNMVQVGVTSGTDMAPWYPGATATGFFAWRWVSADNKDAFYTVLNNINDAIFRRTYTDGQLSGHDNFNYVVSTWEHKITDDGTIHTKTEAYFMWQRDAYMGGTGSIGPVQSFGGGGGLGAFIPGYSLDYGVLNYTMFAISKMDYLTIRNELWNDPQGERTGVPDLYSSHSIGWSHNFNSVLQFRPEIGYYHSYGAPAFNFGTQHGMLMGGFDVTLRF